MNKSFSLASARTLAPDAFRRWVLGGTSLGVLGYGIVTLVDIRAFGFPAAMHTRDAFMLLVSTIAFVIAARVDEVVGCALAIGATWLEVETAFPSDVQFPTSGMLVLPALILSVGLLFGVRTALVATIVTIVTTIVACSMSPALQASGLTTDAIYWFTVHAITMAMVWVLLALGMSAFARVFRAMEVHEQDLAETIRAAPDGILLSDRQGRVVLTNPAAELVLGMPHGEIINRSAAEILMAVSGRRDQVDAITRSAAETPTDLQLRAADGTPIHVEITRREMERGRHQLLIRNVTPRVRAEEQRRTMELQLSHAQRLDAVGRLAGGLSHDFNNILTAVSGSAELLRFEQNQAERHALLDEIIAARDRGAALTRQLLSFARREVTQPRVIDLAEHVHGMHRLLQRVAGDRQRLRLELAVDCRVLVDPGQMEQALVNLVANARDAMPDGGWCTITVESAPGPEGPRVLLHVDDDGVGMTPEITARAFEPFFTTKARGQGTGLGLASVHGMAEQSNGIARIASEPGRGTRVTLEFPAANEAATLAPIVTAVPAERAGPYRILVAEDDSGTRRIVERILRHAGYDVSIAADGTEACVLLEAATTPFDIVLSDVMMPGCTGPELADRVKALHPGTPVLLMTGYAEDQLSELADKSAMRDVITKPFSGSELTGRISELLRREGATLTATSRQQSA